MSDHFKMLNILAVLSRVPRFCGRRACFAQALALLTLVLPCTVLAGDDTVDSSPEEQARIEKISQMVCRGH